jgi:hypothetical protein
MPAMQLNLDADGSLKDWKGRVYVPIDKAVGWRVGLLRGGMESGKHSVSIATLTEGGEVVFLETSLELFLGAADAFRARLQAERDGVV